MDLNICKCGHFQTKHDYLGCDACDCIAYRDRITPPSPFPT